MKTIQKLGEVTMTKYSKMSISKARFLGLVLIFSVLSVLSFLSCGQPDSLNSIKKAFNFPNPFEPSGEDGAMKKTTIRIELENVTSMKKANISVNILDTTGCKVWSFEREIQLSGGNQNIDIEWFGKNGEGKVVSQGLYTAKIKLKALESEGSYGGDVLTEEVTIAVK